MGTYSRWVLIGRWAVNRINIVNQSLIKKVQESLWDGTHGHIVMTMFTQELEM